MELQDLVGEHVLYGVDMKVDAIKAEYGDYFEDCQVINFDLDGVVYTATEDPDDGYRSSMKELIVSDNNSLSNRFPGQRVIGRIRTDGHYGETDEVLELIDVVTGKIVLEAGTENISDYYPGFVAIFRPENMAINQR